MTTRSHQGSAKIYQFPVRPRPNRAEPKPAEPRTAPDLTSLRVASAALGSAWYHEEAVREAELASLPSS
jgi:hypothetical protein